MSLYTLNIVIVGSSQCEGVYTAVCCTCVFDVCAVSAILQCKKYGTQNKIPGYYGQINIAYNLFSLTSEVIILYYS